VLRGLAVVGPPCIHQHNAREAARRAHHDAFGANRGAPWRNTTEGGGQRAAWRGRVGESVCGICVGRVPRVYSCSPTPASSDTFSSQK
jgi:hypothetical protein